jgi:hypothetical protein
MIDEPFTYLAVADSRQYFAVITLYMLAKCTQELYTVCPSDMTLHAAGEPNSLIALFLGNTDIFSNCKRLVINGILNLCGCVRQTPAIGFIVLILLKGSQYNVRKRDLLPTV